MSNTRIVCAAIRDNAGRIICGPRHYDLTMHKTLSYMHCLQPPKLWEQGFIDQNGKFYSRKEAFVIASAAGQIIRRCGGDDGVLYSENLY